MVSFEVNNQVETWVENPFTGQELNVEPIFRFNERPLNPFRQDYPLHRIIMVLKNAKMLIHEKSLGNDVNAILVDQALKNLEDLILSFGDVVAKPVK